jgi:hypothetical protein
VGTHNVFSNLLPWDFGHIMIIVNGNTFAGAGKVKIIRLFEYSRSLNHERISWWHHLLDPYLELLPEPPRHPK